MRDAFQPAFGHPTKEQLQQGMSIYKFNGNRLINGTDPAAVTDATPFSPWWSPTYGFKHDAGLEQRMAVAEKLGVSLRKWGRLTSAIKENWSSLEWLLTIELKVDVYAWFGGFKGMSRVDEGEPSKRDAAIEAKGGSANLPGGGMHFYIPHLTGEHVNLKNIQWRHL